MAERFPVSVANHDHADAARMPDRAVLFSEGIPKTIVKAAEARYFLEGFAEAPANEIRQRFYISAATKALGSAYERLKQDYGGTETTAWRRERWANSLGDHEASLKQHRDDFVHGSGAQNTDKVPLRLRVRKHNADRLEVRLGAAADQTAGKAGEPIARGLLGALEAIEEVHLDGVQRGFITVGSARKFWIAASWEYEDEDGRWHEGDAADFPIRLDMPVPEDAG